ncbi:MAG: hypothetical protein B6A08_12785 [Sorangiineae bacterium NIC37A_2]|jgi:DNA-binding Lrp family transcriptional regulator|nr:MAG: hypothetical protein B6A08_12785 [Sorangiineae bacterium NIC37A_2]
MAPEGPKGEESPELVAVRLAEALIDAGEGISLDRIAEALGPLAISPPHISALIDRLEEKGVAVQTGEIPDLGDLLGRVLRAARERRRQGLTVSTVALGAELNLEPRLVRVALLYAEVLMRGRPLIPGQK